LLNVVTREDKKKKSGIKVRRRGGEGEKKEGKISKVRDVVG